MRLLCGLFFVACACSAATVDVITNGSFETGSLSGWSSTGSNEGGCGVPWHVVSTGFTGCNTVDSPTLGSFAAANTFDGSGPKTYTLSQTFIVPSGVIIDNAILSWIDTSNVTVGCCGAGTASREFYVDLTAEVTSKIYSQLFVDNCGPTHPACTAEVHHWSGHFANITSFLIPRAGQSVTVGFNNYVPNVYSGGAGFALDGVSLAITTSPLPEPATFWLASGALLLALGRRYRRSLQ